MQGVGPCPEDLHLTETNPHPSWTEDPPPTAQEGTWDQAAKQEVAYKDPPPPCEQTNVSKNTTLPQTSFCRR